MSLNQYMDPADNGGEFGARTPLLQDDDDNDGAGAHTSSLPRPQLARSSSSSNDGAAVGGGSLGFARGAGHEDDGPDRRRCRRRIPTLAIIVATLVAFLVVLFLAAVLVPRPADKPPPPQSSSRSSSSGSSSSGSSNSSLPVPPPPPEETPRDGRSPRGVHLGLTGRGQSEMHVMFATGVPGVPVVELARRDDPTASATRKVDGTSVTYGASDMCEGPATSTGPGDLARSPGYLHSVRLTGLEPGTDYAYRVGIALGQGVEWDGGGFEFRTQAPGGGAAGGTMPATTFLAFADMGRWGRDPHSPTAGHDGGSGLVAGLIASVVDERTVGSVHIFGDLSYADGDGRAWDEWLDMIQPFASRVPVMVGVGNHEYDHDGGGGGGRDPSGVSTENGFSPSWGEGGFGSTGGECGVPISKRFTVPDNGNGVFWYSYDQPLVHTVMLSTEHDMAEGSNQYTWLEGDLSAVDRRVTPWLVVEMHRPMYNPELYGWSGAIVSEGLQNEIEDLLLEHKVDLVLSGHYHSYFRSCDGLYLHACENGGPTYVTVGTGGAPLDGDGGDMTSPSSSSSSMIPNDYTEFFDRAHWGVGRAEVYNATTMHWEFVAVGGEVTDEVWLTRDR